MYGENTLSVRDVHSSVLNVKALYIETDQTTLDQIALCNALLRLTSQDNIPCRTEKFHSRKLLQFHELGLILRRESLEFLAGFDGTESAQLWLSLHSRSGSSEWSMELMFFIVNRLVN